MSVSSITGTKQYLAFRLEEGALALEVSNVREILEFTAITKVPGMPEYMRGVINLRGSVAPVLDMRLKFGLTRTEETVDTCIVVVEGTYEEENIVIGALVDSVEEVFELEPEAIEAPPNMGARLRTDFIKGMGKKDDSFIIILDVDRVFSLEELAVAKGAEGKESTQKAVNG